MGIKHASADIGFVTKMLDRFGKDFRIFAGLEEYTYPMMAVGALGTMNAVANLVPGKVAAMVTAALDADMLAARKMHFELFELNQSVFFDTNPIPLKYMMKRLGLIRSNEHRLPMLPAASALEARLDGVLKRAGLLD